MQGAQGHGKGPLGLYPQLLAGEVQVVGGLVAVEQYIVPGHGMGSGAQRSEGDKQFEGLHRGIAFIGVVRFL